MPRKKLPKLKLGKPDYIERIFVGMVIYHLGLFIFYLPVTIFYFLFTK